MPSLRAMTRADRNVRKTAESVNNEEVTENWLGTKLFLRGNCQGDTMKKQKFVFFFIFAILQIFRFSFFQVFIRS